jgi:BMFP domain-containing protein YqiC
MLVAALKLRPVHFVWKKSGAADSGLIAQEVRAVLPDLVTGDESRGVLTVDYSKVGVIAVGAIQQQQTMIERLRAENSELRQRLERIEAALRDAAAKR